MYKLSHKIFLFCCFVLFNFFIYSPNLQAKHRVNARFLWKTPLLTLVFSIDKNGRLGVNIEKSIVTPIGRLSIEGSYENDWMELADWLIVIKVGSDVIEIALSRDVKIDLPNDLDGKTSLIVKPNKRKIELIIDNPANTLSIARDYSEKDKWRVITPCFIVCSSSWDTLSKEKVVAKLQRDVQKLFLG